VIITITRDAFEAVEDALDAAIACLHGDKARKVHQLVIRAAPPSVRARPHGEHLGMVVCATNGHIAVEIALDVAWPRELPEDDEVLLNAGQARAIRDAMRNGRKRGRTYVPLAAVTIRPDTTGHEWLVQTWQSLPIGRQGEGGFVLKAPRESPDAPRHPITPKHFDQWERTEEPLEPFTTFALGAQTLGPLAAVLRVYGGDDGLGARMTFRRGAESYSTSVTLFGARADAVPRSIRIAFMPFGDALREAALAHIDAEAAGAAKLGTRGALTALDAGLTEVARHHVTHRGERARVDELLSTGEIIARWTTAYRAARAALSAPTPATVQP
jgi:hypothetical protein